MDKFDNFVVTYDGAIHRWFARKICLENDVAFLIEFADNRYNIYTLESDRFVNIYDEERIILESLNIPSSVLAKALMIYPDLHEEDKNFIRRFVK